MRLFFTTLILALSASALSAATPLEDAVLRADSARVAATIAGNADRLANLLSDDLRYGQADGRVQTKDEFLAAVLSNEMRYESYDYEELHLTPAGDDVATLSGRARIQVVQDGHPLSFRLRFLAVWKREAGAWRLFAYQSAQLPAPTSDE